MPDTWRGSKVDRSSTSPTRRRRPLSGLSGNGFCEQARARPRSAEDPRLRSGRGTFDVTVMDISVNDASNALATAGRATRRQELGPSGSSISSRVRNSSPPHRSIPATMRTPRAWLCALRTPSARFRSAARPPSVTTSKDRPYGSRSPVINSTTSLTTARPHAVQRRGKRSGSAAAPGAYRPRGLRRLPTRMPMVAAISGYRGHKTPDSSVRPTKRWLTGRRFMRESSLPRTEGGRAAFKIKKSTHTALAVVARGRKTGRPRNANRSSGQHRPCQSPPNALQDPKGQPAFDPGANNRR